MNRYDQILEAIFCSWVKTLHPAYNIYANYTSSRNGGPNCYVLYLRPWNNKIFSQTRLIELIYILIRERIKLIKATIWKR